MSVEMRLQIRDPEVRKALADLIRHVRSGGGGPMRDDYRRAAARYLGFVRRRFVAASRGSGVWPDLSVATKLRRLARQFPGRLQSMLESTGEPTRAGQAAALVAGRKFAILRDTSTLFASLTEGSPGNHTEYLRDGVVVGSNVFYAQFHQDPKVPGRPPRREIFVQPDDPTEAAITNDLANGLLKVLDGGG